MNIRRAFVFSSAALLATASLAATPGSNGRIAFQDSDGDASEIAVVNADASGRRVLTSDAAAERPAWKPESFAIAFGSGGALSTVDLVTEELAALLAADGYELSEPAWSPDGSMLAFIGVETATGKTDLWTANADGSDLTNVTDDDAVDSDPSWTPDGSTILFSTDRDGNFEIYSIHPDGSGPERLTDDAAEDRDPDMSPDGSTIVFVRIDPGFEAALWKMNADGTDAEALTDGSFAAVTPAFSPDGTLIAFAGAPEEDFDLWTMLPDGSGLTLVAGGPGDQTAPTWETIVAGDNLPPVADAGEGGPLECTSPAGATATLDGSASTDPDDTEEASDIVLYEWFEDFGTDEEAFLGTGAVLDVPLDFGEHAITLQVTDSVGQTDWTEIFILVEDTTPPTLRLAVTPSMIWPPNHRMVPIHAVAEATDVCDPEPVVLLVDVTSNEDPNGHGSGHTSPDIEDADLGTADFDFSVRAERAGGGSGRIYTATYSATDASLNQSTAEATITVPHDQRAMHDAYGGEGKAEKKKAVKPARTTRTRSR